MLKRCFLVLCLALGLAAPAAAQSLAGPTNIIICNKTVTFSGLAAVTQLVAPVSGKIIALCGWHVTNSSATSYTFAITFGTQTTNPCDTGTVNVTPALSVLNSAPSADHIDYAIASTTTAQSLCITPSNAALSGLLYYSQF